MIPTKRRGWYGPSSLTLALMTFRSAVPGPDDNDEDEELETESSDDDEDEEAGED